ncbi:structural protein [Yersinia phage YerA41]|uniref:Structural protein n=1 Tax=Yersinia phage vB_Yru_GN1 TaxID=3074381 RepID=A0AA86IWP7_9CAUD|nr:structural protein [Yersinia phage YerA41]BES79906.1 structural protein [Yersinia phage vB_Yru_GN1]
MKNLIKSSIIASIIAVSFSAHAEYTEINPPIKSAEDCSALADSSAKAVVYLINNQSDRSLNFDEVVSEYYQPISDRINRQLFSGMVDEQYNHYVKYVAKGTTLNRNAISQIATPIEGACKRVYDKNAKKSGQTEQAQSTFNGKVVEYPDIYSAPWINNPSIKSISQCRILSYALADGFIDIKSGKSSDTDLYYRRVSQFMDRKDFDSYIKFLVQSTTEANNQLKEGITMGFMTDCDRRFSN